MFSVENGGKDTFMSGAKTNNPFSRDKYGAVLFDLDGVITDTAKMHATCWKKYLTST